MEEKSVLFQIKSLEILILRDFKDFNIKKIPSLTQMKIIDYIIQNKKKIIYQKDLEEVFNLRRATISEVLITMEKNNMIKREISKNDTRTKEIKLSNETKKLFEENKKRLKTLEEKITQNIQKEELETFLNVITKMKENIKK